MSVARLMMMRHTRPPTHPTSTTKHPPPVLARHAGLPGQDQPGPGAAAAPAQEAALRGADPGVPPLVQAPGRRRPLWGAGACFGGGGLVSLVLPCAWVVRFFFIPSDPVHTLSDTMKQTHKKVLSTPHTHENTHAHNDVYYKIIDIQQTNTHAHKNVYYHNTHSFITNKPAKSVNITTNPFTFNKHAHKNVYITTTHIRSFCL